MAKTSRAEIQICCEIILTLYVLYNPVPHYLFLFHLTTWSFCAKTIDEVVDTWRRSSNREFNGARLTFRVAGPLQNFQSRREFVMKLLHDNGGCCIWLYSNSGKISLPGELLFNISNAPYLHLYLNKRHTSTK